jgi:hypothetical protein
MLAKTIFIKATIHVCSTIMLLSNGCHDIWVPTAAGINQYDKPPVENEWTKVIGDTGIKPMININGKEGSNNYNELSLDTASKEASNNNQVTSKQKEDEYKKGKIEPNKNREGRGHTRGKSVVRRSESAPPLMQSVSE